MRVDKNVIFYTKNVFYLKNIHLCASVFQFFNEEYLPLCKLTNVVFSTLEKVIFQTNIHICLNSFKKYSMKNIKNNFLLKERSPMCECLVEEYIPLCELTKMVFSTL